MEHFNELYKKEYKIALKYLHKNFPNILDKEELLQNTFVKFLEKYYHTWDPTKSQLNTYFYNFLKMETLSLHKSYKTKPYSLDKKVEEGDNKSFLDLFINEEYESAFDMDILNSIFDNLPEKYEYNYKLLLMSLKQKGIDISIEEDINFNTYKSKIRIIRDYISKEYKRLSGDTFIFQKKEYKDKHILKQRKRINEYKKKNPIKIN